MLVAVAAEAARTEPPPTGPLRVAILQGNDKNRDLTDAAIRDRYLPNSHFALARQVEPPVDLVIFPESSMDTDPRSDPYLGSRLSATARRLHSWVLANAVADAPGRGSRPPGAKALNLNVLYAPDGSVDVVDWKTGPPKSGLEAMAAAVQLAVYRLAWHHLTGTPLKTIHAAFHHVAADVTVRPADLLDEAALTDLVRSVPSDP